MTTDDTVVIVGAGMAGLACARTLLEETNVILLEASDRVGGRVRSDDGMALGAEFVHGKGTILTEWMDELVNDSDGEDIFTLSHADGGGRPDRHPTKDGQYGMFYVNDELILYNDERLEVLNQALETILEDTNITEDTSVGQALHAHNLPPHLQQLAQVGYGHTVGSTDLHDISLYMQQQFEHYWEENEQPGDVRRDLMGLVHALEQLLQNHTNCSIQLNSVVTGIQQANGSVQVSLANGDSIQCNRVVVTLPPTLWSSIDMDLPASKRQSSQKLGFPRALKVLLTFTQRIWPSNVQSLICTQQPVPELWFREVNEGGTTSFIVTAFLMSTAADQFAASVEQGASATDIVIDQLVQALGLSAARLHTLHVSTIYYDWGKHPYIQGGYVYPRVGLTPQDLQTIAAPHGSIHFAGEGTSTNAGCTVQAAMETGVRAAHEILADLG